MTPHSCKITRLPNPSHAKARPFLRPRGHRTTMRPIHHSPFHLSRIPPFLHPFLCQTAVLHRLRSPSHQITSSRHIRRSRSAPAPQGPLPNCPRLLGTSFVHLRIYDRFKSHLRGYLQQQVVVDCRATPFSMRCLESLFVSMFLLQHVLRCSTHIAKHSPRSPCALPSPETPTLFSQASPSRAGLSGMSVPTSLCYR